MRNLVLFLGLFLLVACKQSNKSIGDAVLIPIHTQIPLYQKINGSIIDYTMNDTIREVYPFIGIYKIKGSFAKVEISEFEGEEYIQKVGWIETKYLGTNLNNYSGITPIMSEPDQQSTVVFEVINPQWGDYYRILDAYDGWLKIENIYNPQEKGWLAPQYQCNNPYTTCN